MNQFEIIRNALNGIFVSSDEELQANIDANQALDQIEDELQFYLNQEKGRANNNYTIGGVP